MFAIINIVKKISSLIQRHAVVFAFLRSVQRILSGSLTSAIVYAIKLIKIVQQIYQISIQRNVYANVFNINVLDRLSGARRTAGAFVEFIKSAKKVGHSMKVSAIASVIRLKQIVQRITV